MKSKLSFKQVLLIVSTVGVMLSSLVVFFIVYAKDPVVKAPEILNNLGYGIPIRIRIPTISVDAVVESVGTTTKNEMDVPKEIIHAAWFNLGPRPGDFGSAVIDGHFGWKEGRSAVFDNLNKLKIGDKIYIEEEDGVIISFTVRELKTYSDKENAYNVFNSSDNKAHLNLITCGGVWNKASKSYSNRIVVFADKEI